MRTAFTLPLALVFIGAACLISLLDGALRVLGDADAVVETVRAAGVRDAIVDAAADAQSVRNLAEAPDRAHVWRPQRRLVIETVLAEDWWEATLRRCHAQLVAAVAAAPRTASLDLRPMKGELARAIHELHQRGETTCTQLAGEEACARDQRARHEAVETTERALGTVAQMPNVLLLTGRSLDPDREAELRRWLARAPDWRVAALGGLGGLLGLIALINLLPLRRLFGAVGLTVFVAAGASIAVHAVGARLAREELQRRVAVVEKLEGTDPVIAQHVAPAFTRAAGGLIGRVAETTRGPLVAAGIVGLILAMAGLALRRPS